MAELGCNFCGHSFEASFFKSWYCDCDAGDWGLFLKSWHPSEIHAVFEALAARRSQLETRFSRPAIVVAKEVDGDMAEGYIDSLLLFCDQVLVTRSAEDLAQAIGEQKYERYHAHGLITSIWPYKDAPSGYDLSVWSDADSLEIANLSGDLDLWRLFHASENLGEVYTKLSLDTLIRSPAARREAQDYVHRAFDVPDLVGCVHLLNCILTRREIAAYVLNGYVLADDFYGYPFRLREVYPTNAERRPPPAHRVFQRWLKSTTVPLKQLDPDALFEFRSKEGLLTPYIDAILASVRDSSHPAHHDELLAEFATALERRLAQASRVLSKGHQARAHTLVGLTGTLGALIGGPIGALVGGVAATELSRLALEFDRRVPPPLAFIYSEIVRS